MNKNHYSYNEQNVYEIEEKDTLKFFLFFLLNMLPFLEKIFFSLWLFFFLFLPLAHLNQYNKIRNLT